MPFQSGADRSVKPCGGCIEGDHLKAIEELVEYPAVVFLSHALGDAVLDLGNDHGGQQNSAGGMLVSRSTTPGRSLVMAIEGLQTAAVFLRTTGPASPQSIPFASLCFHSGGSAVRFRHLMREIKVVCSVRKGWIVYPLSSILYPQVQAKQAMVQAAAAGNLAEAGAAPGGQMIQGKGGAAIWSIPSCFTMPVKMIRV